MCGIAGIVHTDRDRPIAEQVLRRMAASIQHRGPDGYGLARGDGAGLVSTRLAIFDIPSSWQPMLGDGSAMVFNGEIFNYPELRAELVSQGESFATSGDTEVLLRLLDRVGVDALHRCNGQFVIAHLERESRTLTLVRDRFGVRPLHYALLPDGGIVFGSEIKALVASGLVEPRLDPAGIDETFTWWSPRAPQTVFAGVRQLPPGHVLRWRDGQVLSEGPWWTPSYEPRPLDDLGELLRDSVRLRLRADVPVGAYLSGGLDSSLTTALAVEQTDHQLRTFSVAFRDPHFDERGFQQDVAEALGSQHHVVEVGAEEIAGAFRDVVWHCETPIVRTAPVPMYLLAQRTREQGITVVGTGEGADELFWGYDLFKEAKVRAFCGREPGSTVRPALLDRLYPYFAQTAGRRGDAWRRFFLDAGPLDDPLFSHQPRFNSTAGVKALYGEAMREQQAAADPLERARDELPAEFYRLSTLERAAYLEVTTLLSGYLLAAQGDRMAMAHGVEGRYPFLDHRVFEHSVSLAAEQKLCGLREKVALRELAKPLLPAAVASRPKQPYRSPDAAAFFNAHEPEWVGELLAPERIAEVGVFDATAVAGLVRRCRAGKATGFRENMMLVGVLSTQALYEAFCKTTPRAPQLSEPRVRITLSRDPAAA